MWASTADTLVAYKSEGSACKFADRLMGGLKAVSWRCESLGPWLPDFWQNSAVPDATLVIVWL